MNEPQHAPAPAPPEKLPEATSTRPRKSLSNRLLAYSFLVSVLVNIGWVVWVAHSDIFGGASGIVATRETKIKVFHPIAQKRKLKPPRPLPPPPPPKQPPHVKPPPPLRIPRTHPPPPPHVQPSRPQPPRPKLVPRTISVVRTKAATKNPILLPKNTNKPQPKNPILPGPDPKDAKLRDDKARADAQAAADAKAKADAQAAADAKGKADAQAAADAKAKADARAAADAKAKADRPKVEVHRVGWTPIVEQEAAPQGEWQSPQIPSDVDPGTLTSSTVVISFEVSEKGRATNIKVRTRSGNSEVDDACQEAVRSMRFQPAVQDHYFQSAHLTHKFDVG